MKNKEEILKEHIALFRPKTMFGFPEVYKDSVLDAMDDYTSELRAELDEVKITAEALVYRNKELASELKAVTKEMEKLKNHIGAISITHPHLGLKL